jgi:hypothetical protein
VHVANPSRREKLNHSTARTLAALLGTVPVALGFGMVLSLVLPLSPSWRVLLGGYSVFPVWVALVALVFLAPSGRRAWVSLLAAVAVLVALVLLAQRFGAGFGRGRLASVASPEALHDALPEAPLLGLLP